MSYYENRIKVLEEKVAEMARMQRHKAIPVEAKLVERIAEYQADNTRLKAEVERLTDCKAESDRLKAEVERLRKAGDAMVDYIERTEANAYDIEADGGDRIADWNAAKGSKPSV